MQDLHLGKEIYLFFFRYGKYGIAGMIISAIIIGYAIYKTIKLIKKYDLENYNELLDIMKINLKTKHINLKTVLNFIINLFLLISFFVMCAGISAYFKQELLVNEIISSILVAICCYIILNKNTEGLIILNWVLIPLIMIFLLVLGSKMVNVEFNLPNVERSRRWIIDAILYASYNSITLISILIPMKKYIKNKSDIIKITIACILIMILLTLIIFALLINISTNIEIIELPAVYSAGKIGYIYKYLYGIIILGAIITTAISSAYGFLNNISKTEKEYKLYNKIVCFLAIFISLFGFSNLVNSLYPIFGVLGLIQIGIILKCK